MIINKSNYENYALDYLEGTLPAHEKVAMKAFLNANATIKAELDAMLPFVEVQADETIVFEQKQQLLRREGIALLWFARPMVYRVASGIAAILLLTTVAYQFGYRSGTSHINHTAAVEPLERHGLQQVRTEQFAQLPTIARKPVSEISREVKQKRSKSVKPTQPIIVTTTAVDNQQIASATVEPNVLTEPTDVNLENNTVRSIELLPSLYSNIAPIQSIGTTETAMASLQTIELNTEPFNLYEDNSTTRLRDGAKGLLARLPFSDLTADTFIPTYYRDEASGE